MSIEDKIRSALKSNNAIIGYKESIKFIKMNSPKLIVIAENTPEKIQACLVRVRINEKMR